MIYFGNCKHQNPALLFKLSSSCVSARYPSPAKSRYLKSFYPYSSSIHFSTFIWEKCLNPLLIGNDWVLKMDIKGSTLNHLPQIYKRVKMTDHKSFAVFTLKSLQLYSDHRSIMFMEFMRLFVTESRWFYLYLRKLFADQVVEPICSYVEIVQVYM